MHDVLVAGVCVGGNRCGFGMICLCHPHRGLEQETALPRDSYLQPYYKDVYGYLRVGPPLLLVVKDLNMSRKSEDINAVCSIAGCRDDSLLNQVRIQAGAS